MGKSHGSWGGPPGPCGEGLRGRAPGPGRPPGAHREGWEEGSGGLENPQTEKFCSGSKKGAGPRWPHPPRLNISPATRALHVLTGHHCRALAYLSPCLRHVRGSSKSPLLPGLSWGSMRPWASPEPSGSQPLGAYVWASGKGLKGPCDSVGTHWPQEAKIRGTAAPAAGASPLEPELPGRHCGGQVGTGSVTVPAHSLSASHSLSLW